MDGLKLRCVDTRPFLSEQGGRLVVEPVEGELISLTVGHIYNGTEEDEQFYRVIDDSGEDYLYLKCMFEVVTDKE